MKSDDLHLRNSPWTLFPQFNNEKLKKEKKNDKGRAETSVRMIQRLAEVSSMAGEQSVLTLCGRGAKDWPLHVPCGQENCSWGHDPSAGHRRVQPAPHCPAPAALGVR